MPFVLNRNGFTGWKGQTGATVSIRVTVAGLSKLVSAHYNGQSLAFSPAGEREWTTSLTIATGSHRTLFTFAGPSNDTFDIYEYVPADSGATAGVAPSIAGAAAAPDEQELAREASAQAPTLGPQIEGVS